jgi:hypothetical protein
VELGPAIGSGPGLSQMYVPGGFPRGGVVGPPVPASAQTVSAGSGGHWRSMCAADAFGSGLGASGQLYG